MDIEFQIRVLNYSRVVCVRLDVQLFILFPYTQKDNLNAKFLNKQSIIYRLYARFFIFDLKV